MQVQNTILLAAAAEESRRQLREIFQTEYQLTEARTVDQVQLILSGNP